jgi:hypothetical protein
MFSESGLGPPIGQAGGQGLPQSADKEPTNKVKITAKFKPG